MRDTYVEKIKSLESRYSRSNKLKTDIFNFENLFILRITLILNSITSGTNSYINMEFYRYVLCESCDKVSRFNSNLRSSDIKNFTDP